MRGFKQEHVSLPPRVLQHPEHWRLERWLVEPGCSVHREQRIAVFRSLSNAALEYAFAPRSGKLVATFLPQHSAVDASVSPLALIEFCPHSVVFKGICAVCGETAQSLHFADTKHTVERIPVAYEAAHLAVSRAEAESRASVNARHLLASQRLSLVLDLDHTLVHATDDARAPEMISCFPPNVDVNSVRAFQLGPVTHPTAPALMHVKLRPHLAQFLQRVSANFELHIYTMGTRAYADQIAAIIDPGKKLFGGRITSREDFAEGRLNQKSIQRLFPCDDSMVLIVDDREDVWISATGQSFMPNLVRAEPYHFWDGLHEIYNRAYATYTVQRLHEMGHQLSPPSGNVPAPTAVPAGSHVPNGGAKQRGASRPCGHAHGQEAHAICAVSGAAQRSAQTEQRDRRLADHGKADAAEDENERARSAVAQNCAHSAADTVCGAIANGNSQADTQNERLVQNAERKDADKLENESALKVHEEQKDVCGGQGASHSDASGGALAVGNGSLSKLFSDLVKTWWEKDTDPKVSNHLLKLADVLGECHSRFFCVASRTRKEKGTVYTGPAKRFEPPADVKKVLASVRREVLRDCVLSFTGVIPTGVDPRSSALWNLAQRLGAQCCLDYENGHCTHLVASKERGRNTRKYKQAVESGCAFVVSPAWVEACSVNFERQDEFDYQLDRDDRFKTSDELKSWVNANFAKAGSLSRKRSVVQMYDAEAGDDSTRLKRRKLDSPCPSVRDSGGRSPVAEGGMLSILSQDEIGAAIEAAFATE